MFLALGKSLYQWVGSRLQFDHCSRSIQRVVRGFIGRARSAVTCAVMHRSVVLQSASRRVIQRRKYVHGRDRIHWAAVTLQRHVRGYAGRRRVRSIVLALHDARLREFEREKEAIFAVRRASHFTRWCLRRNLALEAAHEGMEQTMRNAHSPSSRDSRSGTVSAR